MRLVQDLVNGVARTAKSIMGGEMASPPALLQYYTISDDSSDEKGEEYVLLNHCTEETLLEAQTKNVEDKRQVQQLEKEKEALEEMNCRLNMENRYIGAMCGKRYDMILKLEQEKQELKDMCQKLKSDGRHFTQ